MRNLAFLLSVALLLGVVGTLCVRYWLVARRSANATWDDLLKRLTWMDRDAIATIALDAIEETGGPRHGEDGFTLEPEEIWKLLGGLEGLETIERNCQVLVELAAYVQRWHPEAVVVAEQLRLNAREIEWHVGRLKGAAQTGNLQGAFADYAQRAVATYYMMTRHVLELYELASAPELAQLQAAI